MMDAQERDSILRWWIVCVVFGFIVLALFGAPEPLVGALVAGPILLVLFGVGGML